MLEGLDQPIGRGPHDVEVAPEAVDGLVVRTGAVHHRRVEHAGARRESGVSVISLSGPMVPAGGFGKPGAEWAWSRPGR